MSFFHFFSRTLFLNGHGLVAVLFSATLLVCFWYIINSSRKKQTILYSFASPHNRLLAAGLASAILTFLIWRIWLTASISSMPEGGLIGLGEVLPGDPWVLGLSFMVSVAGMYIILRRTGKKLFRKTRVVKLVGWLAAVSLLWLGLVMNLVFFGNIASDIHYLRSILKIEDHQLLCYIDPEEKQYQDSTLGIGLSLPEGWSWRGYSLWHGETPTCSGDELPLLRDDESGLTIALKRSEHQSFNDLFSALQEAHPSKILYVRDQIVNLGPENKLVVSHPKKALSASDPTPTLYIDGVLEDALLAVEFSETYLDGSRKAFPHGQKEWFLKRKDRLLGLVKRHLSFN